MKSVSLDNIIQKFELEILWGGEGYQKRAITTADVIRPGLPLSGYFEHFEPERLQVIGTVETAFLAQKTQEERAAIFERYFQWDIAAVIITRNIEPFPECMEAAKKHDRTVLRTDMATSDLVSALIAYLKAMLSPCITRHGVLMEIYGEGVLLLGESGVGKSETAIELVKRGHRLIADDAVEIKRIAGGRLMGTAPELIRHYIELRGIGVVDVCRLFGMSAIKTEQEIDMVINLEVWNDNAVYDRLGLDELYTSVLDVKLPSLTIPVKPGRNLSIIIEVAAMNNRNKKMGYNAAQEFNKQINEHFDQAMSDQPS